MTKQSIDFFRIIMKHILRTIVFIIIFSLLLSTPVNAYATEDETIVITAKAGVVIDFETGIVLWEHNADTLLVPASMIKMVAIHVIYDTIRDEKVTFDTMITVNSEISAFSRDREFANVPLEEGGAYTVRELIDYVIIRSAGASAVALAIGIFGSEAELVRLMNEKAIEQGVEATFFDCWGYSSSNRISAHGMAQMSRTLIMEYPEILEITSRMYLTIGDSEFRNSNLLLGEYEGLDGLKTGFTDAAGRCLTATAIRDGRRIISVIMGARTPARYPETRLMLDYGFMVAHDVLLEYSRTLLLDIINISDRYWSIQFILGLFDHTLFGSLRERGVANTGQIQILPDFYKPAASPFFVFR